MYSVSKPNATPSFAQAVIAASKAYPAAVAAKNAVVVKPAPVKILPPNPPGWRNMNYWPTPPKGYSYNYNGDLLRLPNMVGLGGCQMNDAGFGASISPVVAGAAAGSVIPGIGTAIGSLIGAGVGMLSGKAHYSPWNFLYDDYPQHIYENETSVVALKNALAKYTGQPQLPAPPMYSKKGGTQYQASMQAIVPQYVPGSEADIAAYNRRLNESGGAYEITMQKQLALIPELQAALQGYMQRGAPLAPTPVSSGSPTAPAPYTGSTPQLYAPTGGPAQPYYPPPVMPQYQPGGTLQPSNISITTPGGGFAPQLSDMFGGGQLGQYMPYILGAVGLAVILFTQKSGGSEVRTVYRTRSAPRRRR